MRALLIISTIVIIVLLFVIFTPQGKKLATRARGKEVVKGPGRPDPRYADVPVNPTKSKPDVYIIESVPTIQTGKDATPEEAENLLRAVIRKTYNQLTVMKTPYCGIKDSDVKEYALKNGRTYKEQLAIFVIQYITKSTYPFGNIKGTPISPNILNKYRTSRRGKGSCRPGINIEKLISKGNYKHFTKTIGNCKVNEHIESI